MAKLIVAEEYLEKAKQLTKAEAEHLFSRIRLLRFTLSEGAAISALRVAIEWGRYGDLFEYDFNTGILNMPKNDGTSAE